MLSTSQAMLSTSPAMLSTSPPTTWIFVQFGKVGSSTTRQCMKAVNRSSLSLQGGFGSCNSTVLRGKRCAYTTVLREPVARMISSWEYWCLACKERDRFCGRKLGNASGVTCPHMSLVSWARFWGNVYLPELSGLNLEHMNRSESWIRPKNLFAKKNKNPGGMQGEAAIVAGMPEVTKRPQQALTKDRMRRLLNVALGRIESGEIVVLILESDRCLCNCLRQRTGMQPMPERCDDLHVKRSPRAKPVPDAKKQQLKQILASDILLYNAASARFQRDPC
eukprot:TRINITY_DN27179_c0_g2_i1.p1 TRINITY_DN27179_c0_g2~~TRINITY_DN27179_c0_g2_i1.p1  ORF type:complete len:298 (-),score=4.08 TRINITY_DN27179_c0_g2_i1:289-1122(-)